MVSEAIWQQRLRRFHFIANPERDFIGLPFKHIKSTEHKAAVEFYMRCSPNDAKFVLKMVKKLYRRDSTHAGHNKAFENVKLIFAKITPAIFNQHKEAICALLVRLDRQLELKWYAAHPKSRTFGPSFRWSFRHIMMQRCNTHEALQIEHWMHGHELMLTQYTGADELDALRAYAAHR